MGKSTGQRDRPRFAVTAPRWRPLKSCGRGAHPFAVRVPVVAEAAQVEELPAGPAEDEAQRVHGSGRDRQELEADPKPCDELLVAPGSGSAA